MGETTKIQWCDHTFNAWIGCHKVDAACKHCYAEVDTFARSRRGRGLELWGPSAERHVTSNTYWKQLAKWNRAADDGLGRRARVFVNSLSDVFERPTGPMGARLDDTRKRLFHQIENCGALDFLLLTKRPEHIMQSIPEHWRAGLPPNVWVGASAGDQGSLDARLLDLFRVPAVVRFLSLEPLLGPINLRPWLGLECTHEDAHVEPDTNAVICRECDSATHLDWIICGGESGPQSRPCDVEWIRSIVRQCRDAGTSLFVKQLGSRSRTGVHYEEENGVEAHWFERLKDRKGGAIEEFPADLRVREFPR